MIRPGGLPGHCLRPTTRTLYEGLCGVASAVEQEANLYNIGAIAVKKELDSLLSGSMCHHDGIDITS